MLTKKAISAEKVFIYSPEKQFRYFVKFQKGGFLMTYIAKIMLTTYVSEHGKTDTILGPLNNAMTDHVKILRELRKRHETLTQKDTCTSMFIATASFTMTKTWKQPKHPSIDGWMDKENVIYLHIDIDIDIDGIDIDI